MYLEPDFIEGKIVPVLEIAWRIEAQFRECLTLGVAGSQ
jgi:hypothetical protein